MATIASDPRFAVADRAAARRASSARQTLLRAGGWLGLIGGVLVLIANSLHPHPSDFRLEALLEQIAQTPAWAPIHLTLILALLLILGALAVITLTTEEEPGRTIVRFACLAALLGGALIFVSTAMDGFAMNQLARDWWLAPATEKAGALRAAELLEDAQYAIYSLSVVIFLGLGFILYGLATVLGRTYPKALGWLAILSGTGSFVVGVAQVFGGPTLRSTEIFFVIFSMLSTLWMLIMGALMLRRARAAEVAMGGLLTPGMAAALPDPGQGE